MIPMMSSISAMLKTPNKPSNKMHEENKFNANYINSPANRSRLEKKSNRIARVKSLFQNGSPLTIYDIMITENCSKTTILTEVNKMEFAGFIKSTLVGNKNNPNHKRTKLYSLVK